MANIDRLNAPRKQFTGRIGDGDAVHNRVAVADIDVVENDAPQAEKSDTERRGRNATLGQRARNRLLRDRHALDPEPAQSSYGQEQKTRKNKAQLAFQRSRLSFPPARLFMQTCLVTVTVLPSAATMIPELELNFRTIWRRFDGAKPLESEE